MATGDILFLLLFVVLPTAIIVSGIWAIVFVRMRPSSGARAVDADEPAPEQTTATTALPVSIEETANVAAIAVGPKLSEAPVPLISDDAAALPTLSEREAIASINPVAADLLFDQPQPPAVPTPMRDHAPTEEMPAVSISAESSAAADDRLDEDKAVGDDVEPAAPDDDLAVDDVPDAEDEPIHTDELGPEPPEPNAPDARSDDAVPADECDAPQDVVIAGSDDEVALDGVDDDPEQEAAGSTADLEGPQLSKRGPLRLIPADDADARERRRARGSGRQVPQLGRSVRRQERHVER